MALEDPTGPLSSRAPACIRKRRPCLDASHFCNRKYRGSSATALVAIHPTPRGSHGPHATRTLPPPRPPLPRPRSKIPPRSGAGAGAAARATGATPSPTVTETQMACRIDSDQLELGATAPAIGPGRSPRISCQSCSRRSADRGGSEPSASAAPPHPVPLLRFPLLTRRSQSYALGTRRASLN
jgi:hypothetical protein